ncbi:hypothetical protein AGLY_016698 [Aphis glycines]|uniref:DUF4371 domain-containing protein n=1 Tax=Aphis glycines TaxID=307491 RepID=A0A6G0SZ06_APHGL|nr:hypothetical protein AGLY_016698 [Aphis glycines]
MNLGRTKATSIVKNVIGKCHSEDLANILKSTCFSFIIDESTESVVLRHYAFYNFLLIPIVQLKEQLHRKYLMNLIFDESKIPLNNIIGFASDGCNSMMGAWNSDSSRFNEHMPACKTLPRSCEDLARNIFNYFKSSSKCIYQYKEFQEFCNVSPHKILYPAQTRWLSLSIVVLPKFVNINKLFQSDRPVLCLLHSKMHELYKDLFYRHMRPCNDPTSIDPSNTSYFLPLYDIYLGAEVLNLLNKPEICKNEAMVKDIRKRCREFLITGCRQIKLRFDFDNPILKSLTQLNPKTVFSSKRPTTLIPFIQMFPRVVKQLNISIQDIDDSWHKIGTINLETEFVDNLKLLNVEEFWIQLKLFERDDENPF